LATASRGASTVIVRDDPDAVPAGKLTVPAANPSAASRIVVGAPSGRPSAEVTLTETATRPTSSTV
jgi:hypothetical protein